MTAPRYLSPWTRVREFALWMLAIVVVLALAGFAGRAIYKWGDTNGATRTIEEASKLRIAGQTMREKQLLALIAELKTQAARIDTVLKPQIVRVPQIIAAIPESIYVDHPQVRDLGLAYEQLAHDCEQCRSINSALRDSLTVTDSMTKAREQAMSVLVVGANRARDDAIRIASRKVSKLECGIYSTTALGLGALIGKAL